VWPEIRNQTIVATRDLMRHQLRMMGCQQTFDASPAEVICAGRTLSVGLETLPLLAGLPSVGFFVSNDLLGFGIPSKLSA
jgi:hypothetical protein